MTAQTVLTIVILGYALYWATTAILARLPKPASHSSFVYVSPEEGVRFRIDALTEDEFKVGWVSGWEIGRAFSIGGMAFDYANEDATKGELKFKGRQMVTVHPTDEWFTTSRIGSASPRNNGATLHVFLPWQIAGQMLQDLRHNHDQVCDISIGKDPDWKEGSGRSKWGIYQMELSPSEHYPFGGEMEDDFAYGHNEDGE